MPNHPKTQNRPLVPSGPKIWWESTNMSQYYKYDSVLQFVEIHYSLIRKSPTWCVITPACIFLVITNQLKRLWHEK